jgi:hypothetical protein
MFIYYSNEFKFIYDYLKLLKNFKTINIVNIDTKCYAWFGFPKDYNLILNKPKLIILYNEKFENEEFYIKHEENYMDGKLYFYENIDITLYSHRNITFVTQGKYDDAIYAILSCILFIFGNVIHSSWRHLKNYDEISLNITINEWKNPYNLYYQTYTTLRGIEKVETEWVIKVRADELYIDWDIFISIMKSNPDKIICNNVYFYYGKRYIYHISDHILGGKIDNIKTMFQNCITNLQKQKSEYPYFINHAEQILTYSYLSSIYPKESLINNIDLSRKLLIKHFIVVPITEFINYYITSNYKGCKVIVTPKTYNDYKFITPIDNIQQI